MTSKWLVMKSGSFQQPGAGFYPRMNFLTFSLINLPRNCNKMKSLTKNLSCCMFCTMKVRWQCGLEAGGRPGQVGAAGEKAPDVLETAGTKAGRKDLFTS